MNILYWITSSVETAVLKGFAQAVAKLEMDQEADAADPLDALKRRMNALPESSSNGDAKPRKIGK
jgi:hypothetical protein